MRVLVAATLALLLTASVAAPHVHAAAAGEECAACVVRSGEVAESKTPGLAPLTLALGGLAAELQSLPRDGAPLGATPGQSPPPRA
jgi:hypothetical protein